MSWIILIIVGAIIGWLASLIMASRRGVLWDIIVGIIGSLLGRLFFFDLLHIGSAASAGSLSFFGIFWGVIGAIILIAILRGLRVY